MYSSQNRLCLCSSLKAHALLEQMKVAGALYSKASSVVLVEGSHVPREKKWKASGLAGAALVCALVRRAYAPKEARDTVPARRAAPVRDS